MNEFFIFDDVGRRDRSSTIKVHVTFKINVKFILIDDDDAIGDFAYQSCRSLPNYISNHLYRMIGRYINLSRLTHNIRFSFGFFPKS